MFDLKKNSLDSPIHHQEEQEEGKAGPTAKFHKLECKEEGGGTNGVIHTLGQDGMYRNETDMKLRRGAVEPPHILLFLIVSRLKCPLRQDLKKRVRASVGDPPPYTHSSCRQTWSGASVGRAGLATLPMFFIKV